MPRSRGSVNVVVSSDSADGRQQRARRALERAGGHEHPEALRRAPDRRDDPERDQADHQRALPAEQVAETAEQEQQAAERRASTR